MTFPPALKRPMALGGLVLLLGALIFVMMRAGPLAPVRVTVQPAASAAVAPALFGIGTVEARRAYPIGPTAPGRVLRVWVDVGDTVKAGQLLAEMDPVDTTQRLAALDASIARANSLATAAQAQTTDAAAKQTLAGVNAQRYAELADQHFISPGALDTKLQEQASAQAATSAARAAVLAAGQDIQRLQAERAALLQQRDQSRLLAPAAGTVTARDAEPGVTVVAGQSVLKLVDPGSLWVRTRFDQSRSAGLAAGQSAQVVLRSQAGPRIAGEVARLELQGDSVTEERIAQISLRQPPASLSLGELAEVTVALPTTASTLVVPNASLHRQGEQIGVWLAKGSGLHFAPLTLGATGLDGQVQALSGLAAGDPVVVYSEKELDPKSRVKVVNTLTASNP